MRLELNSPLHGLDFGSHPLGLGALDAHDQLSGRDLSSSPHYASCQAIFVSCFAMVAIGVSSLCVRLPVQDIRFLELFKILSRSELK